jgi:hypothetical protein
MEETGDEETDRPRKYRSDPERGGAWRIRNLRKVHAEIILWAHAAVGLDTLYK